MRATLIGMTAILMWSLLALMTAASGTMPPFELAAITFSIATMPGLIVFAARPERLKELRQPPKVYVIGILGLFGYHALYFFALRNAPAVEAGLISYLWPLLIVVGSAFLPGESLKPHHVVGALIGFAGIIVLKGLNFSGTYLVGYLAALACAFTWSGYSLLTRSLGQVSTDVVTVYCGATALLSALCHMLFETTVWPASGTEWLAIIGLGLFPVGLAFYAWDHGVKNGSIQILGVASYAAPILSTLALVAAGFAEPSSQLILACLMVAGGALIASSDRFGRRQG